MSIHKKTATHGRNAERYQPPPLAPEDDQNEEQPKIDCRDDQEVDGGDAYRMAAQKGLPGLRPPSPFLSMYLATVD
jgi:hypothetical protein